MCETCNRQLEVLSLRSMWLSSRDKEMVKTRKIKVCIKVSCNFLVKAANPTCNGRVSKYKIIVGDYFKSL